MSLSFGVKMRKLVLACAVLSLSGCIPVSQVGMEYVKATAIKTSYAMKVSDYHTSMLSDKKPKNTSECIGNAFRNYNDDGDYIYSDVKVNQLKGENYEIIAKRPYSQKLVSPLADYNVDQILFLTEVKEGTSGKIKIDVWYNPDAMFAGDKIELVKTLIQPDNTMTMIELAQQILKGKTELHFKDIAQQAMILDSSLGTDIEVVSKKISQVLSGHITKHGKQQTAIFKRVPNKIGGFKAGYYALIKRSPPKIPTPKPDVGTVPMPTMFLGKAWRIWRFQ